ncbi:MAG: exonuclease domain-containing protein [Rhodospirillales bacterium]
MASQVNGSEHEFLGGPTTIFDLEFTAWEGSAARGWSGAGEYREIVQIGAVRVDGGNALAEVGRFKTYVRPVRNPVLSGYFVSLTGITQADVDRHGVSFPEALAAFSEFVGEDGGAVVSNGADQAALDENCVLHGIACPIDADRFVDIRPRLARLLGLATPQVISAKLPSLLRLPGRRKEHDALADALAIAQALRHLRETGRL